MIVCGCVCSVQCAVWCEREMEERRRTAGLDLKHCQTCATVQTDCCVDFGHFFCPQASSVLFFTQPFALLSRRLHGPHRCHRTHQSCLVRPSEDPYRYQVSLRVSLVYQQDLKQIGSSDKQEHEFLVYLKSPTRTRHLGHFTFRVCRQSPVLQVDHRVLTPDSS